MNIVFERTERATHNSDNISLLVSFPLEEVFGFRASLDRTRLIAQFLVTSEFFAENHLA